MICFFFSSRRRHTRSTRDWSSDVCSSDLASSGDASSSGAASGSLGSFASSASRIIDRKSVVEGKSVDLGGRRTTKKKKHKTMPAASLYRRAAKHVRSRHDGDAPP